MNRFGDINNIYFLGIGGIGMSALARYFRAEGKRVAGTDRTSSALTRTLEAEGIEVIYFSGCEEIPGYIVEDKSSLVVYTPAISPENAQYKYFLKNGYPVKKRAEVLGDITRGIKTLAVAGTHGKTTTTAILAHLLKATGAKVTAFLGGISENYQSNLLLGGDEVMVVEADEYDRSFLQLAPDIAAITSMDPDHLDIYGEAIELEASFKAFAALLPSDGVLLHKKHLPLQGLSVSVEEDAEVTAENIRVANGSYLFDFVMQGEVIKDLQLSLPGRHNLYNAIIALAMAVLQGAPKDLLPAALRSFKGVSRRFSYKIKNGHCVLIDDYAHHPEEIRAAHQAVREMHPGKEVLAVFQPHLYSRTRDFAQEFAESLDLFDQVLLLDIYPAREEAIAGVTSQWLLEKMNGTKKKLVARENLPAEVKAAGVQVIMVLGAGDIADEVEPLKTALQDEN